MRKKSFILSALTIVFFSCRTSEAKPQTEAEKRAADSTLLAAQRIKSDSLKKVNPFLIMPPDSQYTGDYTDKYPNGVIKFKGFFRFGERHGQWMSFYTNGTLWSELHYDKGKRHGLNITYFENGKKRYEGFYKNDYQDSVWTYYDTSGTAAQKVLYKNDMVVKKLPLN